MYRYYWAFIKFIKDIYSHIIVKGQYKLKWPFFLTKGFFPWLKQLAYSNAKI